MSPTVTVTKRKKPLPTHPIPKRNQAKNKTKAPSPPQLTPFLLNFGTSTFEPRIPNQNNSAPTEEEEDIGDELKGYLDEQVADTAAINPDMLSILVKHPVDSMNCAAPGVKKDWSIILTTEGRQDLNHHSDNPFDFLNATKLDMLMDYWMGDKAAFNALSRIERGSIGEPRVKKVLAKVVHTAPITKGMRDEWVRSAIQSVTAQRTEESQGIAKARVIMDPAKKGYSWVILPVGAAVFKAMEEVRGAMDPRSGTLVLFRMWRNETSRTQHFYATGIHLEDDEVSFEIVATDYRDQISEAIKRNKVTILEMTQATYGDSGDYTTKITFGFEDDKIPFLISPTKLARRFWTGIGNIKRMRNIAYRWPYKCYTCESESHPTTQCPWSAIEIDDRKIDMFNCCHHKPGWVEPPKRPKGAPAETNLEVSVTGTGQRRTKQKGGDRLPGKGKEKDVAMDGP